VAGLKAATWPCHAPPLTPQKVSHRGAGPRSSPDSCSSTLTCRGCGVGVPTLAQGCCGDVSVDSMTSF